MYFLIRQLYDGKEYGDASALCYKTLINLKTRPNGIKDGFSGLDLISTKEGQRSRSMSQNLLHIKEVHPLKQLSKYGSNPLKDEGNRAV